jgi:transmembrane protein TMEM260 (protein O-mannosyltransferase)
MIRPWLGALGIFALAFVIYALSLSPGVFSWDSAELTLGIYSQGIVHATGYPLYLILGRLFTLLPLSADFAIRANLFSAFCGALTLVLLYCINLRLFKNPLIAALSALLFGLAREIWAQAVVAEVYTLHTALAAGIVFIFVLWSKSRVGDVRARHVVPLPETEMYPTNNAAPAPPLRVRGGGEGLGVYALALLFGLAFANHMATILVALILLPYILWNLPTQRGRMFTLVIIGGVAGALYLYLPLRFAAHPQFNLVAQYFDRDLTQPGDLLWMVSGRMFGREMFAYPLLDWIGEIGKFVGELWLNYLGVGLLVGLLGIIQLWRTNRTLCLLLIGMFAAQVLFFSSYDVFDKWTMFHTAYLVWAIFVAAGSVWLLERLPKIPVYAFLGLLLIVQLAGNWNVAGRSGDTYVADRARDLLMTLPQQATLIGPWTAVRPAEYQQIVNGQRPDIKLLDVTLLALGERDRLGGDGTSDVFTQAVNARLQTAIACAAAPAGVYVVDPAILDVNLYEVTYVQTGLYQITKHPPNSC